MQMSFKRKYLGYISRYNPESCLNTRLKQSSPEKPIISFNIRGRRRLGHTHKTTTA